MSCHPLAVYLQDNRWDATLVRAMQEEGQEIEFRSRQTELVITGSDKSTAKRSATSVNITGP